MAARAAGDFPAGTTIAGYRIERELGRGAMAVVCRAIQLNLERPVALKILTGDLAKNDEFVARFFNEARAAAQLSHPNIVQAYDAGVADGNIHYFAMEYVEGETLLTRILREGFLRPSVGLWIALDIGDALDYGWQTQRLTHGDIKPENIMLNSSGQTKLADFGLAKVAGHDYEGSEIMLTPLYAAPELIRGHRPKEDCRADIYSFGATVYHMFAGVPPFPGDDAKVVMKRHLNEPLTPLEERNPAISKSISDFVSHLLEKNPDDRPADWQEVKRKLKLLEQGLKVAKKLKHFKGGPVAQPILLKPPRPAGAASTNAGTTKSRATGTARRRNTTIMIMSGVAAVLFALLLFLAWQIVMPSGREPRPADTAALDVAQAEWDELSLKLARIKNPAECVDLLKAYAAKYDAVPAEYRERLDQYEQALKWRRTAEAVQQEQVKDTSPVPVEKPKAVQPRPTETKTKPKPSAPVKAQPPPSPPEKVQAVAVEERPAKSEEGVAKSAGSPPADVARQDDYVDYIAELSRLKYSPVRNLVPLIQKGMQWLEKYPEDTSENQMVSFVVKTMLPAVGEFQPRLVQKKDKLRGERLPGRLVKDDDRIKDVTASEILFEKRTEYGGMTSRRVPWSALDDPLYFTYLGKLAFGDASVPVDQQRPYLAVLLLCRAFQGFDAGLAAVSDSPERRMWGALRNDLERNVEEAKALVSWRQAQACLSRKEYMRADRLIAELKSGRTGVAARHSEEIIKLGEQCESYLPARQAADLVQQARDKSGDDPSAALVLLGIASTRYGNMDFPNKSDISGLLAKAVAEYSKNPQLESWLSSSPASFTPFANTVRSPGPGFWLAYAEAIAARADLPPRFQPAVGSLRGLGLLDLGEWRGALTLLATDKDLAVEKLPADLGASIWFGRGMVAERFGTNLVSPASVVGGIRGAFTTQKGASQAYPAVATAALLFDYGLLTDVSDIDVGEGLALGEVLKIECPPAYLPHKKRLLFAALSWMIESGRSNEAATALLNLTPGEGGVLSDCFTSEDTAFVKGIASYLANGTGLVIPERGVEEVVREYYYRLLISAAESGREGSRPLDGVLLDQAMAVGDGTLVTSGIGMIGASVCYDLVLLRVSRHMAAHEAELALDVVQRALNVRTEPALNAYYPVFCFLQAGLQALTGQNGQAAETLERLAGSFVANDVELALATSLRPDADSAKLRAKVKGDRMARFWLAWLQSTSRIGGDESAAGVEKAMEQLSEQSVSREQKRLTEGLRAFCSSRR
ncbi:MAG: hypothetical protein A3K19_15540 [Lentisphaerae bacterium RIFOXYB12_FULL_65_16]|nr:MAG: hypothetical protein A3K18_26405 [Lentisphaerae bacterium RIFOXYA12_64_32]OGV88510.1 MAG: hypothetical protein A3K19_15540 [Lentisphaerae bacterium RIFOXYB12_FULL_65_16]